MSEDDRCEFHVKLALWYDANGRKDLPWRNTDDPYHIYLSEIMLQQTQVKTVLERFYFPFLQRFPSLRVLSESSETNILQAWHGLGYYTRARNLHRTSKLCPDALPRNAEALEALPGIGKNTAHAISAFAYHQPYAVMEANVKRVLCRIFAIKDVKSHDLWDYAARLLDTNNPYDYNQAMMDIGATLCTKTAPQCGVCPASHFCKGQKQPLEYPARIKKKHVPIRRKNICVLANGDNKYYATARTEPFLKGLYHFIEQDADAAFITLQDRKFYFKDACELGVFTQKYSHFTLDASVFLLQHTDFDAHQYFSVEQLRTMPVSKAEIKVLDLLDKYELDAG